MSVIETDWSHYCNTICINSCNAWRTYYIYILNLTKTFMNHLVCAVEHGSFSPLVYSTSGGIGPIATVVYWRLASMMAEKCDEPFSQTLFWLRCRLSFSLLCSAVTCLHRARLSPRTTGSVWCSQLDLLGRVSPYGLHLTPLPLLFTMRFYCILYKRISLFIYRICSNFSSPQIFIIGHKRMRWCSNRWQSMVFSIH